MKKTLYFIGILAVFSCIAGWIFYANHFAIHKTNRYRPLANGWVSYHAGMFLQGDGNFFEKLKKSISDDLNHGRFRPVFTFYVSSPYTLSPIMHKRSVSSEGRSYEKLVNGDLRLFSFILLGSVAVSLLCISLLIYQYTKEIVFSLIPAFFIPLSPSLTENLLQNYIDSQEIPLVLWLSVWLLFFFLSIKTEKNGLRAVYLLLSSLFLLLAFLTKETALILSIALFIITVLARFAGPKGKSGVGPFVIALGLSVVCSVTVYLIVSMNNNGYAANYAAFNVVEIKNALKKLWVGFSKYSLNNLYGYIPILIFIAIAIKDRKKALNGLPMIKHVSLLVLFLLLCAGFFLILAPWQPILIKYLFPSIFFFSFAVALSLSLVTAWLKERYGVKGYLGYLIFPVYFFHYNTFYACAIQDYYYWTDTASYGVSVVDRLAKSIDQEVNRNLKHNQSILVEYGANNIPWAKLHLMRILNLDKKINLANKDGSVILNYQMPKAELSSFKKYDNGRMLYLSNNPKELATTRFDVVYKGYTMQEKPESVFTANNGEDCYRVTDERIDWQGRSGAFPSFSLYQYQPVDCQSE